MMRVVRVVAVGMVTVGLVLGFFVACAFMGKGSDVGAAVAVGYLVVGAGFALTSGGTRWPWSARS